MILGAAIGFLLFVLAKLGCLFWATLHQRTWLFHPDEALFELLICTLLGAIVGHYFVFPFWGLL